MYGYYFDPTYFLLIIGMILSMAAEHTDGIYGFAIFLCG